MTSTSSTLPEPYIYPSLDQIRANGAKLEHISYSALSKMSCPASWFAKYILQVPEQPSGHAFLGGTVHHIINEVAHGRLQPTKANLIQSYHETWMNQVALQNPSYPDVIRKVPFEEFKWGTSTTEDAADKVAQRLYLAGEELLLEYFGGPHHRNVPLIWKGQLLSEFELNVPLEPYGGSRLKFLKCRLDLVTATGVLKDFKTKDYARIPASTFKTDLQPRLYALGLSDLGVLSGDIPFKYGQLVYRNGAKDPRTHIYEYDESVGGTITAKQVDMMRRYTLPYLVRRAEDFLDVVMNHPDPVEYFKARIDPGKSCDWCPFRELGCVFYDE